MKSVCIITDSTSYEPRADIVAGFFKGHGFNVDMLLSDFDHRAKKKRELPKDALLSTAAREKLNGEAEYPELTRIYIKSKPYSKNISLGRLIYHHDFAKKVYRLLNKAEAYDILYVMLPGNSLAPAAARLSKEKRSKLIFDLIDMWPESLPVSGISRTPPIAYWRKLRDDNINKADCIITECSLYQNRLKLDPAKTVTMYWAKTENIDAEAGAVSASKPDPDIEVQRSQSETDEGSGIRIAYLGSINNVIDIPLIADILKAINAACMDKGAGKVNFDIIGDGESREAFLDALKKAEISFNYHGAIYDEQKKREILSHCDWGINIMKPGVNVGLTMKSIDYLANGLRLINNIPGDTWEWVEKEHIGVNVAAERTGSIENSLKKIWLPQIKDRDEIAGFYSENFTIEAMNRVLDRVLRNILENNGE
jgi:glycosyltransferase involved in cell wall biosynthesis